MRSRRLPACLLALVGLWMAAPADAADPLTSGRRALAQGRWDRAEERLRKALQGPTRAEARLLLAELLLLRGRPDEAAPLALDALKHPGSESAGALKLARIRLRQGRRSEATASLRKALAGDPEAHAAKALLGRVLWEAGDLRGARRLLEPMLQADGRQSFRTAPELTALGRAARTLGRVRFAFQAFDEASQADPRDPAPLIALGGAALQVFDTVNAERAFAEALRLRPGDPAALVGMARVELEVARTYDDALERLDQALAVDPSLPAARRLKAEVDILAERPDAAIRVLEDLLKVDPQDLGALDLLAAAHDTRGDRKSFERTLRRIGRVRKPHARVFTVAARFAERQNRYPDAIALARRALREDPDHWRAHAVLGIQYTRTGVPGDEAKGRRHLERYYERDDYDARVANLLNLYERWLGDYVWIDDPDVRIRAHKDEVAVIRRVVLPFAKEMLARYERRYGRKGPRPMVLELFHKPNLFALRSLGLPGVASHGLCFGRLVTARSPSSGDFSWGMVVAHELAHVFGLGLSRHRVPRWFTEGMAEYETNVLRPEWTRHHRQALYNALRAGRIPGVMDLSRAFTQARDLGEVVVAYQQSALVIRHLVEVAGYEAVVRAHGLFGKGWTLPRVIRSLTGLSPEDFDRRFASWLRSRTAGYADNWDLDEASYRDAGPFREALKRSPADVDARAGLAAHLMSEGGAANALLQAKRVLASAPGHPLASYVAARIYMDRKDHGQARPLLETLLEVGFDGYGLRRMLADLALADADPEQVRVHLQAAASLDPDKEPPHGALAGLMRRLGRQEQEEIHLERSAMLNPNSPDAPRRLVKASLRRGDGPSAVRWAEHLGYIAPFEASSHVLRGRAHLLNQAPKEAALWFETALLVEPADAVAMVGAAQAALRQGRVATARTWAQRALGVRPDVAGANEVLRALDGGDAP